MVDAIIKEIQLSTSIETQEQVSTLYFGGGTPSILTTEELKRIINTVKERFILTGGAEITIEANPDDINQRSLKEWTSLGINRLSIGIQSFVEEELKWMNRVHTASESLTCINLVRDAGIDNFSVDLIYGSPVLNDDDWQRNMETITGKNIPHISCYALTVEPRTALDKMINLHRKEPIDPEKQARHFFQLVAHMEQAGYEHYEISNFAKPGYRSRHNSSYWSGETYYGFGPAAHSFNGSKRKWNLANNALYIQSLEKGIIPFEEETLTETQRLNEYIMTALRTMEGLDLTLVNSRFGQAKGNTLLTGSYKYAETGKLTLLNNRLILTSEGKLFADGIAADLFF